ncbi:hypothetical protein OPV22_003828 [Ensete ventricosum]|uniref:Mediator complex subunit Med12 domain-containing protein n=1 Tax=Ensete ventricosum TaxID=4639 RepID=A0AAV8S1X3_ENSVE|nr:hypothetical protein OPV22_003828 [Ensete ventricosum]
MIAVALSDWLKEMTREWGPRNHAFASGHTTEVWHRVRHESHLGPSAALDTVMDALLVIEGVSWPFYFLCQSHKKGIWRFGGGTLAPDLGWFASRRGRVGTLTLGCAVGDLQKAVTFAKEEVLFISTVKFCGMHLVLLQCIKLQLDDSLYAGDPSNFSLNSRRQSQVPSYKLKCDKEPLNSRLGPPDFYPQTPNCPEETLTREYLQSGYKETVEGIEEAREIALTQGLSFSKFEHILKFKEALRKRLRVINESRAQKRKAGQAYGVPLSGQLLTKAGVFPEQKPCNEDARRRWIEALSQQNKQLRSLAEHVPHGYRRKALFEVLIRHNVPLLRAAWFIKVNYLNQVRPASTSVPSGTPDKAQFTRSDLLSKDVVEYLQQLLDEFFPKDGSNIPTPNKIQSSQSTMVVPYQTPQKNDSSSSTPDEEPSLDFKWWYMCHLVQWHLAEGLLLPSPIIEMVFNQLQEKESPEAFELLLPLLVDMIESVALSQTYVRMFMDLFVQKIQDPSSSILSSVDSSQKLSLVDAMVGVVRYLIVAVPDTFVALECFPLSSNVVPDLHYRNTFLKLPECVDNVQFDTRDAYLRYLSCGYVVSSIQKRAFNLSKIVNPSLQAHGAAKVLLALDRALITGNVMIAYNSLFEDFSDVAVEERWIAEISPCLRSSLKWIGTIGLSLICSIFFLCEWATCDHRNFHTSLPNDLKLTGRKDFSQIYFAVLLLKLKMEDLLSLTQSSDGNILLFGTSGKTSSDNDTLLDGAVVENVSVPRNNTRSLHDRKSKREIFQGPGPLHDIVVCWLDQHEIGKAGSFRCVEIFLVEIIRNGIFFPHAYVRQLIASGIMDKNESLLDMERQRRHRRILQQLPGSCLFDVLEEARTTEVRLFYEFVHTYSNERRLLLRGLLGGKSNLSSSRGDLCSVFSMQKDIDSSSPGRAKTKDKITQLKVLISRFLRFSLPFAMSMETCPDDSQGNSKRTPGSLESKVDLTEETPGCEECRKGKLQKLVDDRSSAPEGSSSSHSDDEDTWWVKKGSKSQESFKVELPLKSAKHASRGRQKTVRKTQSLAQLAAARIESSQGASTSHVCDNKPDDRNAARWKLGEDEILFILYVLDISGDFISAVKFLIWLIPKVLCGPSIVVQGVRNAVFPKSREFQVCQVGEAFLFSSLQRYENVLRAADLLPEALTASIHRSLATITSNGRPYGT